MSHEDEKKMHWDQQQPILNELYQGVPNYIMNLSNLGSAFELKDRSIRCMDEGAPGGLHIGGSGILLDKERAIEIVKEMHADGIYSHAGCGAAGLYAKQNVLDGNADEYGIEWAKELSNATELPYKGHINLEQMQRPADFHIARVAYYDGTGSFDFSALPGKLPPGYIIARKYFDAEYALAELKIAIGIALGDHGFGNLITSEKPFLVIIIGNKIDETLSLGALEAEVKEILAEWNGRVVVDGFTTPA